MRGMVDVTDMTYMTDLTDLTVRIITLKLYVTLHGFTSIAIKVARKN